MVYDIHLHWSCLHTIFCWPLLLSFSIKDSSQQARLVIKSSGFLRKVHFGQHMMQNLIILVFSLQIIVLCSGECPSYLTNISGECQCPHADEILLCEREGAYIQLGHCVSNNLITGCPYVLHNISIINRVYYLLPTNALNDDQCSPYNRKGLFCSECVEEYGPSVDFYSIDCKDCSNYSIFNTIAYYLISQILPITVLYLVIVLFHINIVSTPYLGYVIFCQSISFQISYNFPIRQSLVSYIALHYDFATYFFDFILKFSTLWNFHLPFTPFLWSDCFSPKATRLDIVLIQYVRVVYPLFLIAITYLCCELHASNVQPFVCLWKPFHKIVHKIRRHQSASDSILHAFATFLLLSFSMLVLTSFELLSTVDMSNINGTTVSQALYIEPSIKHYSKDHIPYMMVALIMVFFCGICPAFLLCLYPTRMFRKFIQCCSPRRRLALDTFVETIQGCYRNGLNGDRDYRMTPAVFMFIVLLYVLYYLIFPKYVSNGTAGIGLSTLTIVITLLLCYLKPYKSSLMNLSLSFHFAMITAVCAIAFLWTQNFFIHTSTLVLALIVTISLPHFVVIFGLSYKLLSHCHFLKKYIGKLTKKQVFLSSSKSEQSLPINCSQHRELDH